MASVFFTLFRLRAGAIWGRRSWWEHCGGGCLEEVCIDAEIRLRFITTVQLLGYRQRGGGPIRKECGHWGGASGGHTRGIRHRDIPLHMTRVATEARSKETAEWITADVQPERRYRPPPGRGLRRPPLRRAKKTLAGRYYQLLSGHAATGTYRKWFGKTDTAKCWWWCRNGEPQSRHHLFTRCASWTEQRRKLWKDVGRACEWEHPHTLSVRLLWDVRAAGAALEFLRTTRAGCRRQASPKSALRFPGIVAKTTVA